jgi:hypothetical protein
MEMPQRNSVCSYLKQTKKKSFFLFSSYKKIREHEGGTDPNWYEGLVPVGGRGGEERV